MIAGSTDHATYVRPMGWLLASVFCCACEPRNEMCKAGIAACELDRERGVQVSSKPCPEDCGGMDPELYDEGVGTCDEERWAAARRDVRRMSCDSQDRPDRLFFRTRGREPKWLGSMEPPEIGSPGEPNGRASAEPPEIGSPGEPKWLGSMELREFGST